MPTVREIEQALFRLAPKEGAMDWDNVGQLLGDPEAEVSRVLVALDITEAVADEAIAQGCQLIVSHHPVMNCKWLPVQTVRQDTPQGHLLLKILKNDLSAICMHTNLDAAQGGVNDALAAALGAQVQGVLNSDEWISRIAELPEAVEFGEFLSRVKLALGANGLRYAGPGRPVKRIGLCGGAGAGDMYLALERGCDTYVTADVKHHEFIAANELGINLVDGGHFPTENVVVPVLAGWLRADLPELDVRISAVCRQPEKFFV